MRSIDGVNANRNYIVTVQKTTLVKQGIRIHQVKQSKKLKLFKFLDAKQIATIAITFVITFVFSIATSQGLAAMQQPQQNNNAPKATLNDPSDSTYNGLNSLIAIDRPEVPAFDQTVLDRPQEVFLPKENLSLPDPLQQRKEFLEQYLRAKNSPLADHVEAISEQSQWKLIIAISRAESSFCKHQVYNNCWGIGGAWNMKNYKNYDQAVADVNRLLETKYIQAGLTTPKTIVKKYVGHRNDNWQAAVQQELDNLANIQ